jgi:hypothetical protein
LIFFAFASAIGYFSGVHLVVPPSFNRQTGEPRSLRANSEAEQPKLISSAPREQIVDRSDRLQSEIPIFCAGGCGEVVGYLAGPNDFSAGEEASQRWCPACKELNISEKQPTADKVCFASTDELAELRKPARNLGRLGLLQAAAVAIIISGSILIATGRVLGIYLAAVGTLVWFIVSIMLRYPRN